MTTNPLFYRNIRPLNREADAALRIATAPTGFGFARGSHLVPAVVDEFGVACRELPILFVPSATGPAPVFLVGARSDQNVMVAADGSWTGAYVPAYLRRYPFILGEAAGAEPIVLVDDSSDLLGAPDGEPLIEDGAESPWLRERITLLNGYNEAAKRTEALGRLLVEFGLLTGVTADFTAAEGTSTVHGLFAINEQALTALPDAAFLRLRAEGALPAIYAALVSLGNIDAIGRRSATG